MKKSEKEQIKREIIEIFDINYLFISNISIGAKYFSFTTYYNNNYYHYKLDIFKEKYKIGSLKYKKLEYSKLENIFIRIIAIYNKYYNKTL